MSYGWGNGSPRSKDSHRGSGRLVEDAKRMQGTPTALSSGLIPTLERINIFPIIRVQHGEGNPLSLLFYIHSVPNSLYHKPLCYGIKKNSGGNYIQVGELAIYAKLQLKLSNDWVGGTSLHFNKFNISNSHAQGWHQGAERTM